MPPMAHNNRIEKPEGMSLTWKPRLVKTPTPTMSATTMAVATTTETVDPPPGSRPGQGAVPVSDAAMSVRALRARITPAIFSSCRLASVNSSNVNNDLNLGLNSVFIYRRRCLKRRRQCKKKLAVPQSGHDFVLSLGFRMGSFPEA